MRVLIVEKTAEGQSICARRIEAFGQSDIEMLDLRVKLVLDSNFEDQLKDADVLLLGSGLGEDAVGVAKTALARAPW